MTAVPDPLIFVRAFWPDVQLYDKQREILYSVRDNDETYVPAGNALGKDFVSALAALWFFLSRKPARVVTTSVKQDQLEDVLWGEIRRFIQTAKMPLPITYNHLKIRLKNSDGSLVPNAELVGQVSNTTEGLLGRHATEGFTAKQDNLPLTCVIFDEASAIDDKTYQSTETWAHRKLIVGNPFPCDNFFRRHADEEAQDVPRDEQDLSRGYHRRIIRISAEDSPNVRYAREEQNIGDVPSGRTLVPGVKGWDEYQRNRKLWDAELQCIGLDAKFYRGREVKLFPMEWLVAGIDLSRRLAGGKHRTARAVGVDPGEGGANTSFAAADDLGIMAVESHKTPDTSQIPRLLLDFSRRHGIGDGQWENVCIDRGGGGYQLACTLRDMGFPVRTVAFGEAVQMEMRRGHQVYRPFHERLEIAESRYVYVNRRAQMYGDLSLLCDPNGGMNGVGGPRGWTLPHYGPEAVELRRQLALIPRLLDKEGRLEMLPKNRPPNENPKAVKRRTLTELIGHSPDEADAVVLAAHGLLHRPYKARAGVG